MDVYRLTLEPRGMAERDIADISIHLSKSVLVKIAQAISSDSSAGMLGYVRVYDDSDICLLTAAPAAYADGFQDNLR